MSKANEGQIKPLVGHFILTYYWFDEMVAGRKDVEYRQATYYWRRRIWDRQITHAIFSRGYSSTTITRPVRKIDVGLCPYPTWDGIYYRIHLGPIMPNGKASRV